MFHYTLHARLVAIDCELAWLTPADEGEAGITIRLRTRSQPPPTTAWHHGDTRIDKTADDDLVVRFPDGTSFVVSKDGGAIDVIDAPAHYTDDDLAPYALGPVLAIALHRKGAVLLHAASVVMHGKAVLFAGASGSGKSTTAAILHRHGYDVLSDDLTEIDDAFHAVPSVAAIRLWPDVLEALHGSADAFPDRAPSWDKKLVRLPASQQPRAIAAILFLEAGPFTRLSPKEGWLRLIAEAYTARLPDAEMSRKIFDVTSALADRVPLFAFTPPPMTDPEALSELLERELAEWLR
jgi:hypothetical protein